MIKKLFLAIVIATFSMSVFAQQVKEVTLTVSGDGATNRVGGTGLFPVPTSHTTVRAVRHTAVL